MDDKEKLSKLITTKMKTIMVGSLAIIEKELEDLFLLTEDRPLTDGEKEAREIYYNIRKQIFDNGNAQINGMNDHLKQYDIHSKRFTMKLPVVDRKERKNG